MSDANECENITNGNIKVNDAIDFIDRILNLSDKQFDTFAKKVKEELPDDATLRMLNAATKYRKENIKWTC